MQFMYVVWVWVMVIFRWLFLFLFSSIEATLIDEHCLDYVLRTLIDKIKENGFELTKKTVTDADYTNDIAILANTPNQTETLLHSLEQATAGIGLHVNAHKM